MCVVIIKTAAAAVGAKWHGLLKMKMRRQVMAAKMLATRPADTCIIIPSPNPSNKHSTRVVRKRLWPLIVMMMMAMRRQASEML